MQLHNLKNYFKINLPSEWSQEDFLEWITTAQANKLLYLVIGFCGLFTTAVFLMQVTQFINVLKFSIQDYENLTPTVHPSFTSNTTNIAQSHLFGLGAQTGRIASGNLELRGVFMGMTPETSTAVIGAIGQPDEDLFSVGSTLPDGSRLVSVVDDHIVIERNGMIENLFLKEDSIDNSPDNTNSGPDDDNSDDDADNSDDDDDQSTPQVMHQNAAQTVQAKTLTAEQIEKIRVRFGTHVPE